MRVVMAAIGLAVMVFAVQAAWADAVILKQALGSTEVQGPNLLTNGGVEQLDGTRAAGTGVWGEGYQIDDTVAHSGRRSARISSDDPSVQYGILFEVQLNQQQAIPIVASGWSRAEDVNGTPSSGYSIWVDITFMDGSHLWGQNAPFDCGTHEWQQRTVSIVPNKPIQTVLLYGLFRGKTGTVWFDDFSLTQLTLGVEATTFNGTPVVAQRAALDAHETITLAAGDDLKLRLDPATGAVLGSDGAVSGFFWRDVQAGSDFRQPRGQLQREGDDVMLRASDNELGLELEARLSPHPDRIQISGTVRDLTGEDRAISLYFAVPVEAIGGRWHDDQRTSWVIQPNMTYETAIPVKAGATGMASAWPLGCVTTESDGMAIALPLDRPRLAELAYDGFSRELYAALHLGLSPVTERFPGQATFELVIYPVDPAWGFRDALARYYALYPQCFTKRNRREGIWMPFTDVSTVEGWEDFGFAFHEGNNNVAFDDQADIASFVYCEPTGYWLRMPPDMPRTYDDAVDLLRRNAEQGDKNAIAALTSAVYDANGRMVMECIDAPWCDGARFILNASPHLRPEQAGAVTRAQVLSQLLWSAFNPRGIIAHWRGYAQGFEVAADGGREGGSAIRCTADELGQRRGAMQVVMVNQQTPANLVIRGWSIADSLGQVGEDAQWCLYVDITYRDGDQLWGQKAFFDPSREGWQQAERVIEVEKPVQSATVYAMLRGAITGSVRFDDLYFGEVGSDANLLRNPGFEVEETGELDGIYIDSSEMGATIPNFRREHWRYSTIPLTFTPGGRVCQLTIFNAVEFARSLSEPLHQQGKLLFANSTPHRFPWLAAWLDVMGTETNWGPGGEYKPNPDAIMNYRRGLCYQRPYLLLLNTVYDRFKPEWVELYFKRSVAYGIFPSFFSHNAADDPYWQRPNLYNRDRPLFKRYIPVCAMLSRAGWEPITHARSSDAVVYVERFGGNQGTEGELYFTIFNDSHEQRTSRITLDAEALGIQRPRLIEMLPKEGTALTIDPDGSFEVRLAPEDLMVIRLLEGA